MLKIHSYCMVIATLFFNFTPKNSYACTSDSDCGSGYSCCGCGSAGGVCCQATGWTACDQPVCINACQNVQAELKMKEKK